MPHQIKLPSLGENITEADVVEILVKAGDSISSGQNLIEIETDKAVVEVPSDQAGVVSEVLVKKGQKIKVGQPVLSLKEGSVSNSSSKPKKQESQASQDVEEKEEITEKPISAQKASAKPQKNQDSEEISPKEKEEESKEESNSQENQKNQTTENQDSSSSEIIAAPHVRQFARSLGVDLADVANHFKGQRLTKEQVQEFLRLKDHGPENLSQPKAASASKTDFGSQNEISRKPMNKVRLVTAANMIESWGQIPHVTQFDQADISQTLELKKKYAARIEKAGGKLTVTAIVIKVAAAALKVFPQFNASIDLENKEIVYLKKVHMGVAVDTNRGLLVPVLKDADQKNIRDIAVELTDLANSAKERKIAPANLSGATFTISNLGGLGTTYFTPLINPPQVAILGVGRSTIQPVWQNESWQPKSIMPLSLSYDHRLIDGADAARFLRWLAQALEDPFLIDLEG